jgi:glycosyltransferase involved in cell wall biosynthesis
MPAPAICVVVPTRDRPEGLGRCLAAVERQTCERELEIVVVDDGSRDPGRVAAVVAASPRAACVRLEGGGPAAARNAGVRSARAEIVCFTDDDCEPSAGWAAGLAAAIDAGAPAAAGPTVVARTGDALARATQLITDHLVERSRRSPAEVEFAPTSNLACLAGVLRAVPFDEGYPGYGEDRDWCARLRMAGHRLAWAQSAVVVHHQRLDLERFVRKHARYGRGAYRFRRSNPAFSHLEPAEFYVSMVRRAAGGGASTAAAVCLAQAATATGFLHEAISGGRTAARG